MIKRMQPAEIPNVLLKLAAAAIFAALPALPVHAADNEWHSLFDGETLDGWRAAENPDSFSVKDGMIIVDGPRAHLFYTGDVGNAHFTDFEMRLEVKTFPGANSGVFFHTQYQDSGWPSHGHEVQVNATHGDRIKTGSIYAVANVLDDAANTDGEWSQLHFTAMGNRVIVNVDGEQVVDFTEPAGVTGPRRISSGTVALQAHDPDSVIHFRNIELRELEKPDPIRALFLTGGEGDHQALTESISHRARVEWTVENEAGSRDDWAERFDVVVYDLCIAEASDAEALNKRASIHTERGVPAVFLPCSLHGADAVAEEWLALAGARTQQRKNQDPFRVEAVAPDHPILAGFPEEGWQTPGGEHYEVAELSGSATPLARASGKAAIWVNEANNVRVFGTTLGHRSETREDPVYLDLLASGLLWSADKLLATGEAKMGYQGPGIPPFEPDPDLVNLIAPDASIAAWPNDNFPGNEGPANAIDGNSATKYLHFDGGSRPTGFTVEATGPSVVKAIRLTSANDAPERDPAAFRIEGSNDGRNWSEIAHGAVDLFTGRHAVWAAPIANEKAYTHYRVSFPSTRSGGGAMQVARVELLGNPAQ